jgi:hypothetical protein
MSAVRARLSADLPPDVVPPSLQCAIVATKPDPAVEAGFVGHAGNFRLRLVPPHLATTLDPLMQRGAELLPAEPSRGVGCCRSFPGVAGACRQIIGGEAVKTFCIHGVAAFWGVVLLERAILAATSGSSSSVPRRNLGQSG